jgi:fatty acid/phospholipid biosynthesis enzyme
MIRVAVDAMGGDRGPDEVVAGALEARDGGLTRVLYVG